MAPSRARGEEVDDDDIAADIPLTKLSRKSSMAPDRGGPNTQSNMTSRSPARRRNGSPDHGEAEQARFLAERAADTSFTFRSVVVGSLIGLVICFSNTYFGLQTGWISGMAMPASLLGYAYFKAVSRLLATPFGPVENVLIQTVAGAVGTMPLGAGFVGVIPALEYLLTPEEGAPLNFDLWRLVVWAVGVCFFGCFIAIPLRREVLIREKLKFPTGTATATMIAVLHGQGDEKRIQLMEGEDNDHERSDEHRSEEGLGLDDDNGTTHDSDETLIPQKQSGSRTSWKQKIKILLIAFVASLAFAIVSFYIPVLHDIPFLGTYLASEWLWTLNPSPAYIGQGIILGPATALHMLFGAILGWGILSPLAKEQGWAPGKTDDYGSGSKGWILWTSLTIMLSDSIISLGWFMLRPVIKNGRRWTRLVISKYKEGKLKTLFTSNDFSQSSPASRGNYSHIPSTEHDTPPTQLADSQSFGKASSISSSNYHEQDAPPEHLISNKVTYIGLAATILLCAISVRVAFPSLLPIPPLILALVISLPLSLTSIRALGETDLNPVSGISKLTQLLFALYDPHAPPSRSIPLNLISGAISESAALQSGDMMQDLKTGHLLGASPKAQFYGQLIGSFVGSIAAALVYRLYTSVYKIPSGQFQIPTGYVWLFTARLVTGQGLPPKATEWAAGAGLLWAALTIIRIMGRDKPWQSWIPGGVAVAVGMYNVPSFTMARAIGGVIAGLWNAKQDDTRFGRMSRWIWSKVGVPSDMDLETLVILASGLILGEGVGSIITLVLASFG